MRATAGHVTGDLSTLCCCHCDSFFHSIRSLSSRFFFFCPHTVIFINITLSKHQSQTVVSLLFNIQLYQTVIIKWIFVLPPKEQRPFLQSPTTKQNVWLTNLLMTAMFIGSRLTYQYLMKAQKKLNCDILGTYENNNSSGDQQVYPTIALPSSKQTNLKIENCLVTRTYYDHVAKRSLCVFKWDLFKVERRGSLNQLSSLVVVSTLRLVGSGFNPWPGHTKDC